MNKGFIALLSILILVAVGSGAFLLGMRVEENRVLRNPAAFLRQRIQSEGPRFFGGTPQPGQQLGGGIMGTIEAIEGKTLIINTQGGSIRVHTTDTTLFEKYMRANLNDFEIGERVIISGSRNEDGSVTARSVRSMPALLPVVTPQP